MGSIHLEEVLEFFESRNLEDYNLSGIQAFSRLFLEAQVCRFPKLNVLIIPILNTKKKYVKNTNLHVLNQQIFEHSNF